MSLMTEISIGSKKTGNERTLYLWLFKGCNLESKSLRLKWRGTRRWHARGDTQLDTTRINWELRTTDMSTLRMIGKKIWHNRTQNNDIRWQYLEMWSNLSEDEKKEWNDHGFIPWFLHGCIPWYREWLIQSWGWLINKNSTRF